MFSPQEGVDAAMAQQRARNTPKALLLKAGAYGAMAAYYALLGRHARLVQDAEELTSCARMLRTYARLAREYEQSAVRIHAMETRTTT